MPWLAVRLQLDAVLAETFSDALLEHGAESVSIGEPGASYATLEALFPLATSIESLLARVAAHCGLAVPAYEVGRLEEADWVRRSQAQFAPLKIGERLWIVPSWHEPPSDAAFVRLDPGLAFGTGSHPTTRLVLHFMERQVRGGERVLDYGCGSGILAIAAAKLGAGRVSGTDIDPDALETASTNAQANGVSIDLCGPDELRPDLYDIVVANILAQPLILLAPLLTSRVAAGGRLALSGILESQATEVAQAYAPGFDIAATLTEEGWALVAGTRR
jgi:ribosomal protein L11 methyltransferase